MGIEDEKKCIAAARTDLNKFSLIYEEYRDDLFRYVKSITNSSENAEDIVSEAFLIAMKKLDKYEARDTSIKFWIIRIARNLTYQSYTKEALLKVTSAGDNDNSFTNESLEKEGFEVALGTEIDLSKYLDRLPVSTKEIILLKLWEEYKFKEISELTDMELSAVKMQFYRGITMLKEMIDQDTRKDNKLAVISLPLAIAQVKPQENHVFNVDSFGEIINKVSSHNNFIKAGAMTNTIKILALVVIVTITGAAIFYGLSLNDEDRDQGRSNETTTQESGEENLTNDEQITSDDTDNEETDETEIVATPPTKACNDEELNVMSIVPEDWGCEVTSSELGRFLNVSPEGTDISIRFIKASVGGYMCIPELQCISTEIFNGEYVEMLMYDSENGSDIRYPIYPTKTLPEDRIRSGVLEFKNSPSGRVLSASELELVREFLSTVQPYR